MNKRFMTLSFAAIIALSILVSHLGTKIFDLNIGIALAINVGLILWCVINLVVLFVELYRFAKSHPDEYYEEPM